MIRNNSYDETLKLRATVALVLSLAIATFPAAFSRTAKAQAPAKATASAPPEPQGGPKEGIKVHGHWTINVQNPDGKLVTHYEFENALSTGGAAHLAAIMARAEIVGRWSILMECGGANQFCGLNPTEANGRLTIVYPLAANAVTLNGQVTADQNRTITGVQTQLEECQYSQTLAQCAESGPNNYLFTSAQLATPVDVVTGQIIQVSVRISFS